MDAQRAYRTMYGDLATAVAANIKTGPSKDWWRRGVRSAARTVPASVMVLADTKGIYATWAFSCQNPNFNQVTPLRRSFNQISNVQRSIWIGVAQTQRQDTTCTKKYQCVAHRSRFKTCRIEGAICRAKFACHADQTIVAGHVVALSSMALIRSFEQRQASRTPCAGNTLTPCS